MRTIQYSLASTKCMDEGWTVQPEVKEESTPNRDHEIFQVEVNSTLIQVFFLFFFLIKFIYYNDFSFGDSLVYNV